MYEKDGWYVLPETHTVIANWSHDEIMMTAVNRLKAEQRNVQAKAEAEVVSIQRSINRLLAIKNNPGQPLPDGLVDDDIPF